MAGSNIEFLGYLSDEEVREQMARCRALVFPGEEDFGLVPLEAMAAGRPVIAYGAGGALDTVIEGETGVFFREPTSEALIQAVSRLGQYEFDPDRLRRHAQRFGVSRFRQELGEMVERAHEMAVR